MRFDTEEMLKILACPRCIGSLQTLSEDGVATGFACENCSVVYPIRDDIPVMLIDESVPRKDWDAGVRQVSAG
ncbi:MAG: glycine cleavage system protein H [Desulfovibrio sp.]|jgi:uncharacterized protein YbaR (Trm112 family)|nr:glycine cleavage system protein H [Desulfovibrio sp.]